MVAARAAVARLSAHLSCALPLRWPSRHQGAAALGASARESEAWASWTAGMQALPTAEGAQPSSAAPPPPPPPRRSSRPRPPRCAVTLMEHTVPLPGGATALEVRDELVVGSAQWRACTVGDAELAAVCEVCTERRVRARFAWGRAPSDEHMGDVALLPLRSHHVALSATALGHCSQGPAQGPAALVPAATASVPLAALLRAAGMEEAEEGEEGDDAWGGITVPLDAGAAEGPTLEAATAGLPAHAVTAAVSCCAVLLSVPGPPQRAAQATGHRGPRTAAIGEDGALCKGWGHVRVCAQPDHRPAAAAAPPPCCARAHGDWVWLSRLHSPGRPLRRGRGVVRPHLTPCFRRGLSIQAHHCAFWARQHGRYACLRGPQRRRGAAAGAGP